MAGAAPHRAVYTLVEALRERDADLADLRAEVEQLEAVRAALLADLHKRNGPNPRTARGIAATAVLLVGSIVSGLGAVGDLPQGVAAIVELRDRFASTPAGAASVADHDALARAQDAIEQCQRLVDAVDE